MKPLPNALDFQCPDCEGALTSLSLCTHCGREFPHDEGTPILLPSKGKTITFSCGPDAFDPRQIPLGEFYRYPARSGQSHTGAYHLDRAHDDILSSLPANSLVIDIGCGGAQMGAWAVAKGLRYIGVDISKMRIHGWLQEHGGPDILCDAHTLPFRSQIADAVYTVAAWEHLAFPQVAAKEAARVLRPGGYHLGSVSFLEPWHDSSYFHMTPFGIYMNLSLAGLRPLFIWPEVAWPGFKAILAMGNKATQPFSAFGHVMNAYYLAPKVAQFIVSNRRLPRKNDLIGPRGLVTGAVAWIAQKPECAVKDGSRA